MIDPKSVGSHALSLYAFSKRIGVGTGFVVRHRGIDVLVSNYHIFSGRNPNNGELLFKAAPDRVLIPAVSTRHEPIGWAWWVQRLVTDVGDRQWVSHPTQGPQVDVAALPLKVPPDVRLFPYDFEPGPDLDLPMSSAVSIVGFPEGLTGPGITAIWKAGTVASELDLPGDESAFFWIDSNTRRGMSGSPVVARRLGAAQMRAGPLAVGQRVSDRTLGVYAGRAYDAPDMTLGRVWLWTRTQEVVDEAVSGVLRGASVPVPCSVGHIPTHEEDMVKVDPKFSVALPVVDQKSGEQSEQQITLGKLIREIALGDQRMGRSLDAVRTAARIEGSLKAAEEAGGEWEISDEDYALLRECFEAPSSGYNPHVGRMSLPVLEYFMAAGNAEQD